MASLEIHPKKSEVLSVNDESNDSTIEERYESLCKRLYPTISLEDAFKQRAEEFTQYVHIKDKNEDAIDFSNPNSVLERESYKHQLYIRAQTDLNTDQWSESWIGTKKIFKRLLPLVNDPKNNLINFLNNKTDFNDHFRENSPKYDSRSERVIYEIFKGDNERKAFEDAMEVFGKKFPTLAYLFFIKDETRFLPISPDNFEESFKRLNIDIKLSGACSWEKYRLFINIIDCIREMMPKYLQLEHAPTLLEAHSFVWIVGDKEYSDWFHNNQKYKAVIEEEQRKLKAIKEREANKIPMKAFSEFSDDELREIGPKLEGKIIYNTRQGDVRLVKFNVDPLSIDISVFDDETEEYGEVENRLLNSKARENFKVHIETLNSIHFNETQEDYTADNSSNELEEVSGHTTAESSRYSLTLKQQLVVSVNDYVHNNGTETVLDGSTILDMSGLSDSVGSIFPSDYCYNRYNNGLKGFNGPFLFEYLATDSYKLLGEGYPYTGMVYHKPKGGEEQKVGYWTNGSLVLYDKNKEKQPMEVTKDEIISSEELEHDYQDEYDPTLVPIRDDYSYVASPEKRQDVTTPSNARGVASYPRSPQKRENALFRANYQCECGYDHKTFLSKRTHRPYVEVHHLIPLEYWKCFENSLDVEANIVCLCSNCHNEIHYGKDAVELVKQLYYMRKEELFAAGIGIDLEELVNLYQ